ncbi:uncharacterized protein LOC129916533 [Episyrphus balteatus]|uniref:uncharacterized protein LOC129916533 n=1 Tax=Episyrphus balteatus TaxID=286459 RepID=UPI002485D8AE|nr:uncharacterized protein LOC129916533 [Episyrphus balteatus]
MCRPFILLNGFILCIWSVTVHCNVQDWEYVFLRVESNTTNADILAFNLRPIRVSRGVYALNGSIYTGKPLDDTYLVDFKLYRSETGSSDYKATPFGFSQTTFYNFMTKVYVKMLQEDLKDCTNVPHFEGEFEGPMPQNTYTYKNCVIRTDGMPGHLQPGVYRITAHFVGPDVEMWLSLYCQVNTKAMV